MGEPGDIKGSDDYRAYQAKMIEKNQLSVYVGRMNPNLLFICTDEQSFNTLGSYGNMIIDTPHLDALAERSVRFENTYVTQPVCTASRSTLMTGRYPHSTGCTENNIALDPDEACFPELLGKDSGHVFGSIGKWHLGDEVFRRHGFEEWVSIEDGYRKYYSPERDGRTRSDYFHFLLENGYTPDVKSDDGIGVFSRPFAARLPEELTKAHFVADRSIDFIRRYQDSSFVLFSQFLEPHMPFFGPRDDQYNADAVPLPESFDDDLEDLPLKIRLFHRSYRERGHSGLELKEPKGWREIISRYWGLVSMVDTQVGRILDALRASNAADNTIVVFTSDHGDMMGAHGLLGKCVMFEEAIRVPLLIEMPQGLREKYSNIPNVESRPISQVDLIPTLLELLGGDVPESLDGSSLFYGNQERDVMIEWNGMNSGFGDVVGDTEIMPEWREYADDLTIKVALDDPVRTIVTPDKLKYSWSHRREDTLFDLENDPHELVNLVTKGGMVRGNGIETVVEELRNRIETSQVKTLDPVVYG